MSNHASRTILMVALDFPPCQSAGVQRTLKFAEYLAQLGWQPIVLTVNESVHANIDGNVKIPPNVSVYRCHSLDASKDFSIKGKYFAWSKVPDRWWSWAFKAIPLGKSLIDKYKPDVIWSTYPISTAHFIAYRLQKYSRIPWVADYRDPLQCRYDNNVLRYSSVAKWIEKKTIEHCAKAVFTTERTAQLYRRLYPDTKLAKFVVIENGFDEGNFKGITVVEPQNKHKYILLHSGAVYENGRDPTQLFRAINELQQEGVLTDENFELIFRGAINEKYAHQIQQLNLATLVKFKPNIPYKESLTEMASVSGLLLIQGRLFNNQIPGKAYEYIRCNKNILALTPMSGSTGYLLNRIDSTEVVEGVVDIKAAIKRMLKSNNRVQRENEIFSRYAKTQQLALLLNDCC